MSTRSNRRRGDDEEAEEDKTEDMDEEKDERMKEEPREDEDDEDEDEANDNNEEGDEGKKESEEEKKDDEGNDVDKGEERDGGDQEKDEDDGRKNGEKIVLNGGEKGEHDVNDKIENGTDNRDGDDESEAPKSKKGEEDEDDDISEAPPLPLDPEIIKQQELIDSTPRTTELEHALYETLKRKECQVERLSGEVMKLKAFISKRKQTYKRKRKDEGAPTRALSAYNIFVQDRFSKLAKENEQALNSADTDAVMKRVPPASLVASTGNQWKELSAEEKAHYEERAREDRKRYEEQMAKYQPPDKQANRKRNKTGYNMFFSAHVLRLKQSEAGVPSERGSVARLVGNAWKQLSAEEKQYYEREADKMNGMNPVDKDDDDDDAEDKRSAMAEYPPNYPVQHGDMHMHAGMPPPMHGHPQHPAQHDPRQHSHYYPPNYAYPQPPYHGYHDQAAAQGQHRHPAYAQGRAAHAHYQYPPHGHPGYDQRGMGM